MTTLTRVGRLGIVLLVVGMIVATGPVESNRPSTVTKTSGSVWTLNLTGTIDLGLASYVQRVVFEATERAADLLVVRMNTFGGRVDAATEIRDTLMASGIPTVAYIQDRAWSAGALIALACDWIWMAPGSSLGAAEPRPADAKTISALRAEFQAMAERRGRPIHIAAAMVDSSVYVDGLSKEGEVLTLTAREAKKHGYADGIASRYEDVVTSLGFENHSEHEANMNWAEYVARFLTDPTVGQLLLVLGFIGLLTEVTAPGWGVPGSIGLLLLALFFGSRVFIGLVGWEVPGLFVLGLVFLVAEVLIVPGFGLLGLGGLAAVGASFYLALAAGELSWVAFVAPAALLAVGGVLTVRREGIRNRLVLTTRGEYVSSGQKTSDADEGKESPRIGDEGFALTPLRPAGTVRIKGLRIDAVSEGGYVPAGVAVVVVRIEGTRVVVREKTKGVG